MNIDTLKSYAVVQADIKILEASRDLLKIKILDEMENDKEQTDFGSFTRAHRTTYVYSAKVNDLSEKLKLRKIMEEQKGIAKGTPTEYLIYTPNKS